MRRRRVCILHYQRRYARGVHFDNIRRSSFFYRDTGRTFSARVAVYGMFAVDGFRNDLRARRFSRSPRTAKYVRMSQFSGRNFAFQNRSYMILPRNIFECFRTPFPIQSLMHKISSRKYKFSEVQNQTIHRKFEMNTYALYAFPARDRLTHGTQTKSLNAAWFPT